MKSLADQLAEIPFFPPGIQVVPRLLPLLNDDRVPTDELAEVVRVDTGLTADILRVCNSAYFGFSVRAQTIQDAIMRLGLRELYKITARVIAAPVLGQGRGENLVEGVDLWGHSLATGVAASVLAKARGTDPEIAFTVGLLHDIGKVRLTQTVGADYAKLILVARENGEGLNVLEAQKWGVDHAVIGGQLLKRWNFPDTMRDAVLLHHSVMGSTPNLDFAAFINLADYLASATGHAYDRHAMILPPNPRALQLAEMNQAQLDELQGDVLQTLTREQAPFL